MIYPEINYIVFLDLDGVMTSTNYIEYVHKRFTLRGNTKFKYRNFMHKYCFQEESIEYLNELYKLKPYGIVLTSTRRGEFKKMEEWNTIFKINGIDAPLIGRTECSENNIREQEIIEYNKRCLFKNRPFIVLDDDTYDLKSLKSNLVHIDGKYGLSPKYLKISVEKLQSQGVEIMYAKKKQKKEHEEI